MATVDPPVQPGSGESPRGSRRVPCPNCRQPALFGAANPFRPFCSARCQGQDFGAWANEAYRVGGKPAADDEA